MDKFAPVLIATLNRFEHFKKCIESLRLCTHVQNTILYIAIDYPSKENHWFGYNKILEFLPNITGFKKVIVLKRESNFGPYRNFKEARETIFLEHDRIIISEDDNVFSTNFLDYINKGLIKYKNDENVFAVCGYNYPIKIPKEYKYNCYYWKGISGWGYGSWKNKWAKLDFGFSSIEDFISKKNNRKELNSIGEHYLPALVNVLFKNRFAGDTIISMNMVKYKFYSVFPVVSKVKNIGSDGSGINFGKFTSDKDPYLYQLIDNNLYFDFKVDATKENGLINNILYKHFKRSLRIKIKTYIKFFLFKFKKTEHSSFS